MLRRGIRTPVLVFVSGLGVLRRTKVVVVGNAIAVHVGIVSIQDAVVVQIEIATSVVVRRRCVVVVRKGVGAPIYFVNVEDAVAVHIIIVDVQDAIIVQIPITRTVIVRCLWVVVVCQKVGATCNFFRVGNTITVAVISLGRVTFNALDNKGKTDGVTIESDRALSVSGLHKPSDDIDINVR